VQAHDFIEHFITRLCSAGIDYMVTGSVAATIYGEPRLTHDIDLVVVIGPDDITRLCQAFPLESYYCPPPEVLSIEVQRTSHAHFNLIHHATGLKADCYLHGGDPLHTWAFASRRSLSLGGREPILVAPPEYVIIRKLEYYREGASQKHLADIRAMLRASGAKIDLVFVNSEVEKRGLTDAARQVPIPAREK